jgi:hypothetical protein
MYQVPMPGQQIYSFYLCVMRARHANPKIATRLLAATYGGKAKTPFGALSAPSPAAARTRPASIMSNAEA